MSRPPLARRKQDFVRTEIRHAALDLFAATGYDATTVEAIATRAGLSRRTFFRYYASKDDLMAQAIDDYGDVLTAAIAETPSDLPPFVLLRRAIHQVARFVVVQ